MSRNTKKTKTEKKYFWGIKLNYVPININLTKSGSHSMTTSVEKEYIFSKTNIC